MASEEEQREAKERGRKRRLVHLLIGITVSALGVVLALRETSVDELSNLLAEVQWWWVAGMFALKFVAVLLKALRWRIELGAMREGPMHRVFHATGLGYFCNMLLPFKLGELVRVSLLRRHNPQVGLGEALSSIAAERVLDGAVLALMVLVCLPSIEAPSWILGSTWLLLAITLAIVLVSTLAPLHFFIQERFPKDGVLSIGRRLVAALHQGTAVMRRPLPLAWCTVVTVGIWLAEVSTWHLGIHAVGLDLSFAESLVISFLFTFALLVPSAPGHVGTLQAMAVYLMAPFGVEAGEAVSASLLLQLAALGTLGGVGLYVFLTESSARAILGEERASLDPPS